MFDKFEEYEKEFDEEFDKYIASGGFGSEADILALMLRRSYAYTRTLEDRIHRMETAFMGVVTVMGPVARHNRISRPGTFS